MDYNKDVLCQLCISTDIEPDFREIVPKKGIPIYDEILNNATSLKTKKTQQKLLEN